MLFDKTDIVLVSWHRPKMTDLVIKSFATNTKRSSYRLIVIDNGSSKSTQDMLRQHQDNGRIDELVLNETNRGLEPARNQGLELVKSDLFVCADNDCVPQPYDHARKVSWLDELNNLMLLNSDYGAIAARTQVMIGTGNIFDGKEDEEIVEFPHPGGSLRIMRTDIVRTLGGWRDVPGRGTEERYICGKLNEIGYKTGFAVKVSCLHLFGDKSTDRWGYPADWKPEKTGHSDIWHPALEAGDIEEDVALYAGGQHAEYYFS